MSLSASVKAWSFARHLVSTGACAILAGLVQIRGADVGVTPAAPERWQLDESHRAISWDVAQDSRLPHRDWIEMSGKRTAAILTYDIDAQRRLDLKRTLVWPTLRIHPNDTHSFLKIEFSRTNPPQGKQPLSADGLNWFEPAITLNQQPVTPRVRQVRFEDGLLTIRSELGPGLDLEQTLTPAAETSGYVELWRVVARSAGQACRIEISPLAYSAKVPYRYVDKGVYRHGPPRPEPVTRQGDYRVSINCPGTSGQVAPGTSGEVCAAGVVYEARDAAAAPSMLDAVREVAGRASFVRSLFGELQFDCPDAVLKTLFDYSKIRACDSICDTKGGPMHAPGGGSYYAAIWANDTVEYVGPFYPFLGYDYGNQATLNALGHFERYLNPEFNPLPSSIIAEGTDIWARRLKADGLPDTFGDRGDAAMLAYGAARFLLAYGNKQAALAHWPLIEWTIEYCHRHKTPEGVIASASDELEGRFSSGNCNLNTSMLTYGGLLSGADLAEALGKADLARDYRQRAQALRQAAARYFEADVAGFPTYQYHEGCKELRAWICIPFTMGIFDRKHGTIAALFSPRLWTDNGILTAENSTTFWDRSTLYALRGVFNAGEPDTALRYLQQLSRRRLLGEHVPYVVEAFPEGNGRHLSAESALYCRVITEGLFGLTPRGFRTFTLQPSLPSEWNKMSLHRVRAFQATFDIDVIRLAGGRLKISLSPEQGHSSEKIIQSGAAADFVL